MKDSAIKEKERGISPIWILPILTLILCLGLLYNNYQNAGKIITISMNSAEGLVKEKTAIMTRGIKVGVINKVSADFKSDKVLVTATIDKDVAAELGAKSLFWVVKPEFSANKIEGLETIFSGSYINLELNSAGPATTHFTGLDSSPPISSSKPGLHITLNVNKLGSIQKKSGIYYRNVQIGVVSDFVLNGEKNVSVKVYIKPEFSHLVHKGSRFFKASGISFEGKLPQIKVHIESFAALLRGGIQLYTPETFADSAAAENGDKFELYSDYSASEYGLELKLLLPSSLYIIPGETKLIYHGIEAGIIQKIDIDAGNHVTATIRIDPRAEIILREGTKFWLVHAQADIDGVKNLGTLLSGPYITFRLAPQDNPVQNTFTISPTAPALKPLRSGKSFYLESANACFKDDDPVYFKNIQVGEVVGSNLTDSGRKIVTEIYIYSEHISLLTSKSVFWQYSGVNLKASLSGIEVNTGPLRKIVSGGISFTSPDKVAEKKNKPAQKGQHFPLYSSYQDAVKNVPALQDPGKYFWIRSSGETTLTAGAPILHANVPIGKVVKFDLGKGDREILAHCFIQKRYQHLITPKTRFYDASGVQVNGGLTGIDIKTGSLQSIINGGIGCFTPTTGKSKKKGAPYTLYSNFHDAFYAKAKITVYFKDLGGLQEGAAVLYKGIEIGSVSSLHLADNLKDVYATLQVSEKVLPLFRANTKIWLRQAQLSLTKVKNLQAALLGPSVAIAPGDGPQQTIFNALATPPKELRATGFPLFLKSNRLNSLVPGSPVYYRQLQIGEVVLYRLARDLKSIVVQVSIDKQYRSLINKETMFWNSSGLTIDAGLFSGVEVRTESVDALLRGGISLDNPKGKLTPAKAKSWFRLCETEDAARKR